MHALQTKIKEWEGTGWVKRKRHQEKIYGDRKGGFLFRKGAFDEEGEWARRRQRAGEVERGWEKGEKETETRECEGRRKHTHYITLSFRRKSFD